MAETILTPGKDNSSDTEQTPTTNPGYLIKDNLLSEFNTQAEKSKVRENLGVLPAENTYTREDANKIIVDKITSKLYEHINGYDHITPEEVTNMLIDFVRNDGTTPFIAPQSGKTPTSDSHLTTKAYVDRLIQNCLKLTDKTKILQQVTEILRDYTKYEDVYDKDQVYTKDQIDNKNTKYVKIDGTTPFESPQSGRTPQISSHLTTKGYVDNLLIAHKEDIDPHGFTEKLNNKLRKYVLKENVYDRTQTYSRGQLDQIIDKLITTAVKEAFRSHEDLEDPHGILDKVRQLGYINKDGSTAFTSPQKGVDAVVESDFVTLRQLKKVSQKKVQPEWITSGPVESTVGYIEEGTPVPDTMTFQELMDAIFYGKGISIDAPEYVTIGNPVPITVCIHGSVASISHAELLKDGELVTTITKEDFENGCITIEVDPIDKDAEFTLKVVYLNGSEHEETVTVKCSYPVFVGLLPKWKFGNTVTMDYLKELSIEEPTNNKFVSFGPTDKTISIEYAFQDDKLRHPFVVVPTSYPDLKGVTISSQKFGVEAFDVIDMIPFQVEGAEKDVIYKMYIYRQALSSLNQKVTFNF